VTQPRLVLVGGFLGAGKTTLLAKAAERLARAGKRVGLITNDQATSLVDTALLERRGASVAEVSGGCFCCRFDDLISALRLLMSGQPDAVIAEPVGSCTDLSATVLQPLKALYGELFRVAPFSVLADPIRLREAWGRGAECRFPDNVMYIFRKQLEEADLIVLNKADTLSPAEVGELKRLVAEHYPGKVVLALSALRGDGLDEWLRLVSEDRPAGQRIASVDYDVYAEGEAMLGWLNASAHLHAEGGADWRAFCLDFLARAQAETRARSAEIAHLKLLLSAGEGSIVANATGSGVPPFVQGAIAGSPEDAELLVNARVRLAPQELRETIEGCLRAAAGRGIAVSLGEVRSFAPARPRPTHRFASAV